ncbi:MAG: metallophosphoesterase family protein [Mangrovibacterium sp.]|nr:metallophosphoesterase family protein [Mangrovibacterium sp.]
MRNLTFFLILYLAAFHLKISYAQEKNDSEGNQPEWIALGITESPATRQAVTWRSSKNTEDGEAQIIVETHDINLNNIHHPQTVKATSQIYNDYGTEKNYHRAIFSDLKSNTRYLYRVGNNGCWSEWFQFKTARQESDPSFSLVYFGDAQYGLNSLYPRVIRQAIMKVPDASFLIFAGDLTGNATEKEFDDFFKAGDWILASKPVAPVPDGHEYRENAKGEKRAELTTLWNHLFYFPGSAPEELNKNGSYYFDYQNARFIMINSFDFLNAGSEKKMKYKTWLESLLSGNTQKWTIVVHHIPLYPIAARREKVDSWYNLLKPLYDQYKVDLVLSGHDHGYARGGIESGGKERKRINGPVYVVSVAGPNMYELANREWYDRIIANTQLFQHIRFSENQIQFRTYDATGSLSDEFLIKKRSHEKMFVDRAPAAME